MKVVKILEATCSTGVKKSPCEKLDSTSRKAKQFQQGLHTNKKPICGSYASICDQAASRPLASSALSFRLRTSGSSEEMAFHPYSPGTPLYW